MSDRFVQRIHAEVPLIERETGGRRASVGRLEAGGKVYAGVIVHGLSVNPNRFGGRKSVSILMLVPDTYPATPPLGVYLDQAYVMNGAGHFVRNGYHGAPTLTSKGWHWYCHALGAFGSERPAQWRPTNRPDQGHNLATVVTAARVALHR